jgi:hypothetical protein
MIQSPYRDQTARERGSHLLEWLGAALFLSIPRVVLDMAVRERSIERRCSSTLCESARTF